jgi:hypothetical protein
MVKGDNSEFVSNANRINYKLMKLGEDGNGFQIIEELEKISSVNEMIIEKPLSNFQLPDIGENSNPLPTQLQQILWDLKSLYTSLNSAASYPPISSSCLLSSSYNSILAATIRSWIDALGWQLKNIQI